MSYLSRVQYTGAGNTALYSIPFAYISKAYIEVRVGGSLLTEGVGFTWQSATSILLTAGNLPAGVVLDIRRATPKTTKLVDFQDGSVLTEASLDLSNDQVFQMVQETVDDMQDRLAVQTDGTIDGQNRRIKNVADPVAPQDAVTRYYADTYCGGAASTIAVAAAASAQSSATAAQLSATAAAASALALAAFNPADFASAAQGTKADNALPASAVGSGPGNVVALGGDGKLPAYDGSKLTGLLKSGVVINTTSGTAHDFTGIPAGVKRITLTLRGVSTSGVSPLQLQLGDSGGVESTGYETMSVLSAVGGTNAYSGITSGFPLTYSTHTAANTAHGAVTLTLVDGATNAWVISGNILLTSQQYLITVAGSKATSAMLDRIRLTTVNGTDTFDAGSVNILYEG